MTVVQRSVARWNSRIENSQAFVLEDQVMSRLLVEWDERVFQREKDADKI